ncbi:5'-methylthioadenosine/adenosylhomocysteine nucleosidase [Candidatus Haliotispira prima]|uniref:adenosylhomocysteine nucleosidase n=1 Tax=Candidatus Haliotispira prima TaxID=3034016 RepID=A0ABY8ML97_9SPIO|nr:5'-methylthioadenosine/adenosylhomocysteine nucleosidase [Candidatus Haliotispira prima]
MKIGIIAAMEEELDALTALLQNHTRKSEQSRYHISTPILEWHYGSLETQNGPAEIVALQSGVGKAQAALHTGLLLQNHKVDYIVNLGSAGGLFADGRHGDIVIADVLAYHDVDVRTFGYKYGQLPGNPECFPSGPHLREMTLQLANEFFAAESEQGNKATIGQIVSGDSFIEHGSRQLALIREKFPKALAVDMEAASIAHIAFLYGCPCLVVRSISDFPLRPDGKVNFQQYLPLAAANAAKIVRQLVYNYPVPVPTLK